MGTQITYVFKGPAVAETLSTTNDRYFVAPADKAPNIILTSK